MSFLDSIDLSSADLGNIDFGGAIPDLPTSMPTFDFGNLVAPPTPAIFNVPGVGLSTLFNSVTGIVNTIEGTKLTTAQLATQRAIANAQGAGQVANAANAGAFLKSPVVLLGIGLLAIMAVKKK